MNCNNGQNGKCYYCDSKEFKRMTIPWHGSPAVGLCKYHYDECMKQGKADKSLGIPQDYRSITEESK